ncbi:MAG TPA: TonB-dependent receptor [Negativicutes bacterium]|nr:TonB-dependent receptor [Negativicutes bacterium]
MKIKTGLISSIIMAGMLIIVPPSAKAAEIPSFDMQEIVIVGEAFQNPLPEASVNVRHVNPAKTATLPEILRQTTGIDIQLRGSVGDNQDGTVKLRGFDARRFTVLLNGRPINSAGVMGGQYIDWNTIPLDTVEKIQIIKGAKSAAYGSTLGGVINIVTREKPSGGEATVVMGDQGRQGYYVRQGGSNGNMTFDVYANHQAANAFLRNNDFKQDQFGARLGWGTETDKLLVGLNYTETRRGFIVKNDPSLANYDSSYPTSLGDTISPGGPQTTPNPGAYWNKRNFNYDLTYRHKTQNGQWQISYWKNDERRREVNYSAAGVLVFDRDVVTDQSDSFALTGKEKRQQHEFGYGIEYKRLRYGDGTWYVKPAGSSDMYPSQKVNMFGAYIDDSWKLSKHWNAYIGLRYDSFQGSPDSERWANAMSEDYNAVSPKLSFAWKHDADTTTYISVNRLWRAPSMAEFYWWGQNYNSGVGSNPSYGKALKPEEGVGYELAMEHKYSPKHSGKAAIYYQSVNDFIQFQHVYPFYAYNINHVNLWGLELEHRWQMDKKNSLTLGYTYQHTEKSGQAAVDNKGLSDELDYRPQHKIGLTWAYDAKPWQLRYTFNYISSQRDGLTTPGTIYTLSGYTVHNVEFVRDLGEKRTLSLSVQNLFDQSYVEQYGYPMPGRRFLVSFTQAW